MERTASWMGSVLFIHLSLMPGISIRLGTGHNHSKPYEKGILPCKKEELQCGNGLCLMNWLRCRYKKDCGKDNVSITVPCSACSSPRTLQTNTIRRRNLRLSRS